jgi:hypothetical protein
MPDGTGGIASADRSLIMGACEKYWALNAGDCSGFVKAVSGHLHIQPPLSGLANDIYDQIHAPRWDRLGTGLGATTLAGIAGAEGKLVIAAWRNPDGHGHVAIVVDFSSQQDRAIGYWGTLGAIGQRYARISASFSLEKLQSTYFACRSVPQHLKRHHPHAMGPLGSR